MKESPLGAELRAELKSLIDQLQHALKEVIDSTDQRIALPPDSAQALRDFHQPLPESGSGAAATIERLIELNLGDSESMFLELSALGPGETPAK